MTSQEIQSSLHAILTGHGFDHYGLTPLTPAVSLAHYESWLSQNYHGEMAYLERHFPIKKSPDKWMAKGRTAIVVAAPYNPAERTEVFGAKLHGRLRNLKIASYAKIDDYHLWLRKQLEKVALELKRNYQDEEFVVATDAQPILERDLAYRAGLGWFGKNTCLIDQRRGSFFLIGEIVTSLKMSDAATSIGESATVPHPDRCGTCRRCIDACPTQAFIEPRVLDARKCISYLTIESKSVPAKELRHSIGAHFFGCDICQDVCPWNKKVIVAEEEAKTSDASVVDELRWILESSSKVLERDLANTPLSRSRGFGLKRNAIVVAANLNLIELRDVIASYATDSRLGELATWALAELNSRSPVT